MRNYNIPTTTELSTVYGDMPEAYTSGVGLAGNILRLRNRLHPRPTQTQLAKLVGGVGQSDISKWELGDAIPNAQQLLKLAVVLNVTLDELVADEDPDYEKIRRRTRLGKNDPSQLIKKNLNLLLPNSERERIKGVHRSTPHALEGIHATDTEDSSGASSINVAKLIGELQSLVDNVRQVSQDLDDYAYGFIQRIGGIGAAKADEQATTDRTIAAPKPPDVRANARRRPRKDRGR